VFFFKKKRKKLHIDFSDTNFDSIQKPTMHVSIVAYAMYGKSSQKATQMTNEVDGDARVLGTRSHACL
jgi:hypothetical protein